MSDALADIAQLGLITAPSPLTALPGLARQLGLASLTLKRDDLLPALGGGTKVRKLDVFDGRTRVLLHPGACH